MAYKNKVLFLFISFLFLLNSILIAQPYQQDQVLRIGYKLGTQTYKSAYRTYNPIDNMNHHVLNTDYNDRIGVSNYEIWLGRFTEHVFYETNLDGLVNSIVNFGANKSLEYDWIFSKFKKTSKNGLSSISAIDYDILNMRIAFGAKGIYGGVQYKLSRVGTFAANDTSSALKHPIGFAYSEDNLRSAGFGLHANLAVGKLIIQNHFMFNWCNTGNKKTGLDMYFKGKEIDLESTICYGKGAGFYVTPFLKKRFASADQKYYQYYGYDNTGKYNGFQGSFTAGIKIGFYLASEGDEDDVYISIAD